MPEPSTNNRPVAEAKIEINLSELASRSIHSIRRLFTSVISIRTLKSISSALPKKLRATIHSAL